MMKRKLQMIIDMGMIVMLPFLMAYQLIGEAAHEWIGSGMVLLFAGHQFLNWHWYKNIFKGKYTGIRIIMTVTNLLLLIIMVSLGISGIMMSKHVYVSLPFSASAAWARKTHLLASYWGFVLMSFHAGLHWEMMINRIQKIRAKKKKMAAGSVVCGAAVITLSIYGIYAFIARQLGEYMLLKNEFVFFDFSEPFIYFIFDYLAMMVLFSGIGHCVMMGLGKWCKRSRNGSGNNTSPKEVITSL